MANRKQKHILKLIGGAQGMTKRKQEHIIKEDDELIEESILGRCSAEQQSGSADLIGCNDDLIILILRCLPSRSLTRFKSVSKQWNSLISDPRSGLVRSRKPRGYWVSVNHGPWKWKFSRRPMLEQLPLKRGRTMGMGMNNRARFPRKEIWSNKCYTPQPRFYVTVKPR